MWIKEIMFFSLLIPFMCTVLTHFVVVTNALPSLLETGVDAGVFGDEVETALAISLFTLSAYCLVWPKITFI